MAVAPEGVTCDDLLDNEGTAFMYIDGVTTVTFFEGPVPVDQLKERLVKICQASPWVAGKLGKDKKTKKVQMVYDSAPTPERICEKLFDQVDLDISPTMPYEAMLKKLKTTKAHVVGGWELLKKGFPYTKLTVAKKDANTWALIFSVSHVVADGYTYYRLLSMFNVGEAVTTFNPTRKHSFVPALKDAVGLDVYNTYMGAMSLIFNYMGNMLMPWGGKAKVKTFYVDDAKVKAAKDKWKAEKGGSNDFVSTNDVVTAYWGTMTRARLSEMAVNFRGRLPDLQADDAGNYEGCILFSNLDFEDPGNIRKALKRDDGKFKSVTGRPLPGGCAMSRCRYRIITNWASFFTELSLGEGCTQTLHLPYQVPSAMPTDICIIFKPTKATLGLFVVTRKMKDAAFSAEGTICGGQILPTK